MRAIFKSVFIFLFSAMMSCINKNAESQQKEEGIIDSVMEEEGQKVRDVNEGIKEGFDESTEELKEKTRELLSDSIAR